jgi:hypothetical protein
MRRVRAVQEFVSGPADYVVIDRDSGGLEFCSGGLTG